MGLNVLRGRGEFPEDVTGGLGDTKGAVRAKEGLSRLRGRSGESLEKQASRGFAAPAKRLEVCALRLEGHYSLHTKYTMLYLLYCIYRKFWEASRDSTLFLCRLYSL